MFNCTVQLHQFISAAFFPIQQSKWAKLKLHSSKSTYSLNLISDRIACTTRILIRFLFRPWHAHKMLRLCMYPRWQSVFNDDIFIRWKPGPRWTKRRRRKHRTMMRNSWIMYVEITICLMNIGYRHQLNSAQCDVIGHVNCFPLGGAGPRRPFLLNGLP